MNYDLFSTLPQRVQTDLHDAHEDHTEEPNDITFREFITESSEELLFEHFLSWNGIVGYSHMIWTAALALHAASIT